MTQALSVGYVQTLTQNVVCALPANFLTRLTCDDVAATFQVSNDGVTFTAATLSGNGFDNGFAFIRLTSAGPTVINVKKWVS